jgi:hypothetical protein
MTPSPGWLHYLRTSPAKLLTVMLFAIAGSSTTPFLAFFQFLQGLLCRDSDRFRTRLG